MNSPELGTPTPIAAERLVDVLGPVPDDIDPRRRRPLLARRYVAVAGTLVTLVEIVVWLAIAVAGGGLDAPWWLWTAVPTAAAVAALTLAYRTSRQSCRSPIERAGNASSGPHDGVHTASTKGDKVTDVRQPYDQQPAGLLI